MNLPNFCACLLIASLFAAQAIAQAPLVKVETVPVRDPGNAIDKFAGSGSVGYPYRIGKYEVTIEQYAAFLNSVARTNTNSHIVSLWNSKMGTDLKSAGIARGGFPGSYTYTVISNGGSNRPISYVSWFDAARFCNWLHNGATNGASTETGAYTLSINGSPIEGYPRDIVIRKADARWWIPTIDEWYKAAYYKSSSTNAGYWLYPTRSSAEPGNTVGNAASQANFLKMSGVLGVGFFSVTKAPYSDPLPRLNYLTTAGAFSNSPSAYGTFDQGGNVSEWFGRTNGGSKDWSQWVGVAGGNWLSDGYYLSSEGCPLALQPVTESPTMGFRVAAKALNADKEAQTIRPFAVTKNVPFGTAVTFTNTNSSAGLPVKFERVSGPVTVSGNRATVTGVGTAVVRAVQGGNANFKPAVPLTNAFTTVKANQTITWRNFPSTNTFQLNGKIPLKGKSSSGLAVVYTSANSNILSISGTNAIMRKPGTNSVTASQGGNANFNAARTVVRTIVIK